MALPRLPLTDPQLRSRHLLALPEGIASEEVEVLAASRFAAARWEAGGDAPQKGRRPMTAAFGIRITPPPAAPVLRLSRHSTLTGPYGVTPDDIVALGLPATTGQVYDVACTRERGEPPYPGSGDRDGINRAFPDGLPVREEQRVVQWLVDAARRLGGSVRIGGRGTILAPDIEGAIDVTVLTDRWIEPAEALAVVQRAVPRARLSVPGVWDGPATDTGRHSQAGVPHGITERGGAGLRSALEEHGVRDPEERRRLMAEAAAFDEMMLGTPQSIETFGVLMDLGVDGMIVVEVGEPDEVPPLLRAVEWAQRGVVAYRVHWEPVVVDELETERPTLEHRVARRRAATTLHAVARVLQEAVGGEIADEADFLVDPQDL